MVKMEFGRLHGIIFVFMLIQFTTQVNSTSRKMDIPKFRTTLRDMLKINSTPNTASNDQPSEPLKPLCYENKEATKVTPCDSTNKFPACFDWLTGNFKSCTDINSGINFIPMLPICTMTKYFQQFVVSCSRNPTNFCFSVNSRYKTIEFCNSNSQAKTCLGTGNTLLPCSESRFKRHQPQVPQLDSDAYYASCENCNIRVVMTVDENSNERPKIEIKSEPLEESKPDKIQKRNKY